MTEKQIKIIKAGLQLFAKNGYDSTSTSKVAVSAGVSEGLIFRHFKSKIGLLDAILETGQSRIERYYQEIKKLNEPKAILSAIIELPFLINEEEYDFWRLLYTLKWQQRKYERSSIESLLSLAKEAFIQLDFSQPESEVFLLEMFLDGAATLLLLKESELDKKTLISTIKSKYNLEC